MSDSFHGARRVAAGLLGTSLALGGAACKDAEDAASQDFSFFVTSMAAMVELSGSERGFGGNLTFNGQLGVLGADEICKTIAERSLKGSGAKGWKAFLSTRAENAIDRIGDGPWFDRQGRKLADDKAGLTQLRPANADPAIVDDLPDEDGVPIHFEGNPGCQADGSCPDNHDVLTSSTVQGTWDPTVSTCEDWTSTSSQHPPLEPGVGHSWPAQSGRSWLMAHRAGGCEPGITLQQVGMPQAGDHSVGAGGGYGAIYCFANIR